MGVLTAAINAAVVAAVGLLLAWMGKGRFEAIHRRFDTIDRRFDAQDQRMDRLEERLEVRLDGFQASLDTMRSDLTQVALAVGTRRRAPS